MLFTDPVANSWDSWNPAAPKYCLLLFASTQTFCSYWSLSLHWAKVTRAARIQRQESFPLLWTDLVVLPLLTGEKKRRTNNHHCSSFPYLLLYCKNLQTLRDKSTTCKMTFQHHKITTLYIYKIFVCYTALTIFTLSVCTSPPQTPTLPSFPLHLSPSFFFLNKEKAGKILSKSEKHCMRERLS